MMEKFMVENVMDMLREDIKRKKLCSSELSFVSLYHNRLIQNLKNLKSIVLFGAGKYGELILNDLLQHGIDTVQCFCDNKIKVNSIQGLRVISPQEAMELYPDAYYVITPRDFQYEMLVQLVHLGINVDNVRLFELANTGLIS